ncbi:hypothetical protein [Acidovorax sp. LjRoot194]|uniref:hypothetical protein n=1 Tax=Acidovorax sp. LjRoot194 TaxID=3342280 RepID=UPI003F50BC5B
MPLIQIIQKSRRIGLSAMRAATAPTAAANQRRSDDVFNAILLAFLPADAKPGAASENYFTPAAEIEGDTL